MHIERRKRFRIRVSHELFKHDGTGRVFSLSDLSEQGFALTLSEARDLALFPLGDVIDGTLSLKFEDERTVRSAVQVRVVRLGVESVGLAILAPSAELEAILREFLDPSRLGSGLRAMPPDALQGQERSVWYRGPSGTDLLLTRERDGSFSRFALYALGHCVNWEAGKGLSTASATGVEAGAPRAEVSSVFSADAQSFRVDEGADPEKLRIAKAVILSSNLGQDLKAWCVRHLGG